MFVCWLVFVVVCVAQASRVELRHALRHIHQLQQDVCRLQGESRELTRIVEYLRQEVEVGGGGAGAGECLFSWLDFCLIPVTGGRRDAEAVF